MRIKRTDLEFLQGVGDTWGYKKYVGTFDDEGKLLSKTLSSFVASDVITLVVKLNKSDVIPVIEKTATIVDGVAWFTLTDLDLSIAQGIYGYDVFYTELGKQKIPLIYPSNFEVVENNHYESVGS
jgi:hypothetical protein